MGPSTPFTGGVRVERDFDPTVPQPGGTLWHGMVDAAGASGVPWLRGMAGLGSPCAPVSAQVQTDVRL